MLSTVPYRRRAVDYSYGLCQVGARVYFRPGCGRLQSAFDEQKRGQKRRASAGYHHGDPTCMWYCCDSLPGPDPGGTLAIGLKDGDDFSCGVRARRFVVFAVADHACFSTSLWVIVAKLAKFRVQADIRSNKRTPDMLERMVVFVAVDAKPPVFPEGISAR